MLGEPLSECRALFLGDSQGLFGRTDLAKGDSMPNVRVGHHLLSLENLLRDPQCDEDMSSSKVCLNLGVAQGGHARAPFWEGVGMSAEWWSAIAAWLAIAVAAWSWWTSRQANVKADRALGSLDRMADALDRIVEGRSEATSAPVEFMIEWRNGDVYTLRNLGPETATGLRVLDGDTFMADHLPDGVELGPLQSHRFYLHAHWGMHRPDDLRVECDQLPGPVAVPVPPRS